MEMLQPASGPHLTIVKRITIAKKNKSFGLHLPDKTSRRSIFNEMRYKSRQKTILQSSINVLCDSKLWGV